MSRASLSLALLATCSFAGPALATPARPLASGQKVSQLGGKIAAAGMGNLTYRGGKLLQNVKIFAVYYTAQAGNGTPDQYEKYYSGIVQSPYFDWIHEYSQGSYKLGRGSSIGRYIDTAAANTSTTSLADSDIQTWLSGLLMAGKIPAPDADTLYVTYFPPGVSITDPSGKASCQVFCAYHGGFDDSVSGKRFRYAVMPDQGGTCAGGCGSANTVFDNSTSVASHEIQEAVSDPDVWAGGAMDLGWYDDAQGEDGDICNGKSKQISTPNGMYYVQQIWSQSQTACVTADSTVSVADFALALDKPTVAAPIGGTATAKVTSTPVGTMTGMVSLTVTGLPMGVTAAFAPASVATSGSSTVTFTLPAGTMPGSYPFTVTGNTALPDNVIHTVAGTLTASVPPPPDMARQPPDLAQRPTGNGGNGGSGGGGSGGNGGGTGGNGGNGGNDPGVGRGSAGGCSVGGSAATSGAWILGLLCIVAFVARRRDA
jgi:hypothetical protein